MATLAQRPPRETAHPEPSANGATPAASALSALSAHGPHATPALGATGGPMELMRLSAWCLRTGVPPSTAQDWAASGVFPEKTGATAIKLGNRWHVQVPRVAHQVPTSVEQLDPDPAVAHLLGVAHYLLTRLLWLLRQERGRLDDPEDRREVNDVIARGEELQLEVRTLQRRRQAREVG